jgi:hypothetical protein
MKYILEQERWKILKAELIIEPVPSSFDLFRLPEKLYIYDTDKGNRINSVLTDPDDATRQLAAFLDYDELYVRDTRYVYDITAFINDELSDADFDTEHGLLCIGTRRIQILLDRLLVRKKPVKLKIYYLSINVKCSSRKEIFSDFSSPDLNTRHCFV